MRAQSETNSIAIHQLVTRILSSFVAIWLAMAHLDRGADAIYPSAIYSIGLILGFFVLLISTRFNHIPIGMALVAGAFLLWSSLGLFGHWPTARHEVLSLAAAGAIAGTGYLLGRQANVLKWSWLALNWSLLAFCLLTLFAFVTDAGPAGAREHVEFDGRLSGFFGSPNTGATLFGISMLLASGRILQRLSASNLNRLTRRDRIYYFAQSEYVSFALFIIAGICLVLTVSRAGIFISLFCIIGLVILEVVRLSRKGALGFLRRKRVLIPVGFGVSLLMIMALTGDINPYASEALLHNSSSRLKLYDTYVGIWLERPWIGHGLGSFNALNASHTTLENAPYLVTIGAAHNVVLQWLVQQGLIGTLIMVGVLGVVFYPMLGAIKKQASLPRHFLRSTLAVTLLVFGHGMVDYALEIPSVMWTYSYIVGLAAGFASIVVTADERADE